MKCPYCMSLKNKSTNPRLSKDGRVIRRRRICLNCNQRYTTYEKIEDIIPLVKKKDDRTEPFLREKVISSICLACRKRPITMAVIEDFVDSLEMYFQEIGGRVVKSSDIGNRVIKQLKEWDDVSYLRFVSIYNNFSSLDDFTKEINKIK